MSKFYALMSFLVFQRVVDESNLLRSKRWPIPAVSLSPDHFLWSELKYICLEKNEFYPNSEVKCR